RYPEPGKSDDKGTETDSNHNQMLYYHKLGTPQSDDILIYKDPSNPEYMYEIVVSTDGRYVILKVLKDCDRVNKLWIFDLEKINRRIGFIDIIKEHPADVLSSADAIAEKNLVLVYMHDVKEKVSIHSLSTGKHIKDLPIPIGSIEAVAGRREDSEFFFKFTSYLNPGIIYRYNFTKEKLSEYRTTEVQGFNSDLFETKQVFIESKDKTKIPVFIVSPK
ncbi:16575_t:CDS:2, partial [Racocetra fulgida]